MQVLHRVFLVDEIPRHLPRQEGKSHRYWIAPCRTLSYGSLKKNLETRKNSQRAVTNHFVHGGHSKHETVDPKDSEQGKRDVFTSFAFAV